MGPEKGRKNVRKIEVPTDTPTEFELGDTAADIQRREDREQREKEAEKQQREEREEAKTAETPQSHSEEGVAEKRPRTDTSNSEMDNRGWRKGEHMPITIQAQERTYDKHLLNRLR